MTHARRATSGPQQTALPGETPPLLSTCEAGQILGISERSVRRAIKEGRLRAIRSGAAYRLHPLDVERFGTGRTTVVNTPGLAELLVRPMASRFIGRAAELKQILALLADPGERLLTLTGPGGIGKTRLALEAAGMMHHHLRDGGRVVFLERTHDPALVMVAIAEAMGLADSPGRSAPQNLRHALRNADLLLVLDNFEHVLPAATEIAGLLADAPGVRILATSRAPLRLSAERVVPLQPMALAHGQVTRETLLASDAVALFLDRAEHQGPLPPVDEPAARAIAEICARVDGLPLGIELAAAATRLFTVHELLAQLSPSLPLLADAPRDAPPRHAALRDAIAWSYDLLAPDERRLFRQLAVFAGGFSFAEVATLAAGGNAPMSPERARLALATLLDHSLVRRDDTPGALSRYTMLETIREFGLEHLAAAGELPAARAAHAAALRAMVQDLLPVGSIYGRSTPLVRLAAEMGNLRAALAWLQQEGNPADFVELVAALGLTWFPYRANQEGAQWLASALAKAALASPLQHARLLIGSGGICFAQGRYADIPALLEQAERLLACAESPPLELAIVGTLRGATFTAEGDQAQAEQALLHARAVAGQIPDATLRAGMTGRVLGNLALTARRQGRLEAARALIDAALQHYAAGGFDLAMAQVQLTEGQVHDASGDLPRALRCWHEGLATLGEQGDPRLVADTFTLAACACAGCADWSSALVLFGVADGMRQREHTARSWREGAREMAGRDAAEQALGAVRAQHLLATGRAMTLREALAHLGQAAQRKQPTLSARQYEILALLAGGQTDREIGEQLFLSRRTVSWHIRTILDFFGVGTRGEAVVRAREDGVLPA
ncbi:MAG: LuxR C-terminal-related transcriptional regulator [Thermomicrobiales bacterium]